MYCSSLEGSTHRSICISQTCEYDNEVFPFSGMSLQFRHGINVDPESSSSLASPQERSLTALMQHDVSTFYLGWFFFQLLSFLFAGWIEETMMSELPIDISA